MGSWWIDPIKIIGNPELPYLNMTINSPQSIFVDKTLDAQKFDNDFNSENLAGIVDTMNNKNVICLNILCPWSCSTSFCNSGKIPLDLMFQKIYPKLK